MSKLENVSIRTIESSAYSFFKLKDSNLNDNKLILGKYKFEKLNESNPKYRHSPESLEKLVNNNPKSISLKFTNVLTPTNGKEEIEILNFRSVLEAAREISIKEQIGYESARYQISKALKTNSLFLNKYKLELVKKKVKCLGLYAES